MTSASDGQVRALLRQAFDWARDGDTSSLRSLLELGCQPNLTNDKGDTLLILAAYHQHVEVVALLLAAGADLDRANDNGQTALASAVFRQNEDIVQRLLDAGADPDAGARSARDIADFFGLPNMTIMLNMAR